MRAILTDWAETALWMAAEKSPNLLRKWTAEKPNDLIALIESKISEALTWEKLAISKGANESGARELMNQMLAPFSPATEPKQLPIAEKEMKAILNKLRDLVKM